MTHDWILDMLDKCKQQGMNYYVVTFSPDGNGNGNIQTFDNIELIYAPPFLETLAETFENLGGAYQEFSKEIIKEIKKEQKLAAKKKKELPPNSNGDA